MRILAQLIRLLASNQEAASQPLEAAPTTPKNMPSPDKRDFVVYPYYLQSFTPITYA